MIVIDCILTTVTDHSLIDPTTGEPLYDTPLESSACYDHLNLGKPQRESTNTDHPYGFHSGKRLLASVEEGSDGRVYRKKQGGRGNSGHLLLMSPYKV